MVDFFTALRRRVLLGDGAMGTMLQPFLRVPWSAPEALILHRPDAVLEVHQAYVTAGAGVIQTNTFGANRLKLAKVGLAEKVEEINKQAVLLARAAAENKVLVAASVGPTGELLEPLGDLTYEEAEDVFAEQIGILYQAGIDLFIVETMSALEEAEIAIQVIRSIKPAVRDVPVPVVCTMSFDTNLRTMMGVTPAEAVLRLREWGADVVGANCGKGLQEALMVIQRMREVCPEALLAIQPNAGLPRLVEGHTVYDLGPEEFAKYAKRFVAAGARFIGSCCGSTPEHTQALARALYL